jgi:transposase
MKKPKKPKGPKRTTNTNKTPAHKRAGAILREKLIKAKKDSGGSPGPAPILPGPIYETYTKNPPGRPTKYRPEYCEQVIQFMAEGKFLFQFGNMVGVIPETLTLWQHEHPEFATAVKAAKAVCLEWWVTQGRQMMSIPGSHQDSKMWLYIMNNLHGWRDNARVEMAGDKDNPIKVVTDQDLFQTILKNPELLKSIEAAVTNSKKKD